MGNESVRASRPVRVRVYTRILRRIQTPPRSINTYTCLYKQTQQIKSPLKHRQAEHKAVKGKIIPSPFQHTGINFTCMYLTRATTRSNTSQKNAKQAERASGQRVVIFTSRGYSKSHRTSHAGTLPKTNLAHDSSPTGLRLLLT